MLDGDLVLLQRCLPPSRLVFQQHSSNSSNWKVVMELLLALCRPLLRHLALLFWLGTLCWNEKLAVDWIGVDWSGLKLALASDLGLALDLSRLA